MTARETWFRVSWDGSAIEEREVLRSTEHCLFVMEDFFRGKKERRINIGNDWFRTRKEAAEYNLSKARRGLEIAKDRADCARGIISAMEAELGL